MRILVTTPSMQGVGVDFISTVTHHLDVGGHDIDVLQFSRFARSDELDVTEVPVARTLDQMLDRTVTSSGRWLFNWVLYHRWRDVVGRRLAEAEYDVVVSDRICSAPGTLAASDYDTPTVILTTGPAATRYDSTVTDLDKTPDFWEFSPSKKAQYPFILKVHSWNRLAFRSASAVVAVSEYDAAVTRETFGVDPSVVYLPVPLEEYVADDRKPTKVTIVNPRTEKKGLDTFISVAEQLPEVPFQVAGQLYDQDMEAELDRLSNVEFLGWCDDMRSVYQNTKVLMIPSKYEEGGPRIVAEAFANGIPVVGSDLGGTPDYIGDGGEIVSEVTDIEAWVGAVTRLLTDEEYYRRKSQIAYDRRELFDLDSRVADFEEILKGAAEA